MMYWLPRRKVLVPTDFSEASVDAIRTALATVESGRDVHALHALDPVCENQVSTQVPVGFDWESCEAARQGECQERLQTFLAGHELCGLTVIVRTGDPALCITRYAREKDIDLIVMAAHGYESGERISIGSVTERTLHNADCPVLVLRPDGCSERKRSESRVRKSNGYSPAERNTGDTVASPFPH